MTGETHGTAAARLRHTEPQVAITLDIDWAPDHVIDETASRLLGAGVRATWFVTHDSPAVRRLSANPELFELGWHPNFFPGSSHGASEADVLEHCQALVPAARVVRTHGLIQSTRLLERIRRTTSIRIDVSLLLRRHANLAVHVLPLPSGALFRIPFWWEDDVEMYAADASWDLGRSFGDGVPGLRVLNFHPIHIALGATSMAPYERLKQRVASLTHATTADVRAARGDESAAHESRTGAAQAFDEALQWLASRGGGQTISGLVPADMEDA